MATRPELLAELLALPIEERVNIAAELLETIDPGKDDQVAEAWVTEIERRCAEIDNGTAVLHDWADVRQRLLGRLGSA